MHCGSSVGAGVVSELIKNGYMFVVATPETQASMRNALDAGVGFFRDDPVKKVQNKLPLDTGSRIDKVRPDRGLCGAARQLPSHDPSVR